MNSTEIVPVVEPTDAQVIMEWLKTKRADNTKKAYERDIYAFFSFVGKPMGAVVLGDLQAFEESLEVKNSSKARTLAAVKSLLTFAYRAGYIKWNVGAAMPLPRVENELAKRILSEEDTIRLIDATRDNPRNHAMLRLMYHCGLRVSEVCGLTWDDCIQRNDGGQVHIWGKGAKVREILVSPAMWNELMSLHTAECGMHDPVFVSRKGRGKLDERQVERIVQEAAGKAGIKGNVSPHWLRHAHASHSLDRGANINLVRDTLGHASLATTGKYTHARPSSSSSQFLPL